MPRPEPLSRRQAAKDIVLSETLVRLCVALGGGAAMALAFPKTDLVMLAPAGAGALLWALVELPPGLAFAAGCGAGTLFFSINYAWFGETAGALIAPFGFFLTLGPALGDAFFGFGLAGLLASYAARVAPRGLVPLCAAAAFALCEWLRSEGLGQLGVPFGSLAYTQVGGPLAPLAAFVGCYGLTFVVCLLGAYTAHAFRFRAQGGGREAVAAFGAIAAAALTAHAAWPARTPAVSTVRVAAVQGNIRQSLKFAPGALELALRRYEGLSLAVAAAHPVLILWPETVIPIALNEVPALQARFAQLARRLHAELAVGTLEGGPSGEYNALYFYGPNGRLDGVYRKRQLVPFAEHLPFAPFLGWIPWAQNISRFGSGSGEGLVDAGGRSFGPVICWESAFSDLVRRDARDGADALLVATDDAWFGTTAGPYQHAQIAQLRAIETGRWVLRAAATGISGIISPDGRYTVESRLDEQTVVQGTIGPPLATVYDRLGAGAVAAILAALYALPLAWRTLHRA